MGLTGVQAAGLRGLQSRIDAGELDKDEVLPAARDLYRHVADNDEDGEVRRFLGKSWDALVDVFYPPKKGGE